MKCVNFWISPNAVQLKIIVASRQNSKWWLYSRWCRKCFYFSSNTFKNDYMTIFILSFFTSGKNMTFMNFFFMSIKNDGHERCPICDDIFQKMLRFYFSPQPLIEMFSFFVLFLML
jgi:hypothetical protein